MRGALTGALVGALNGLSGIPDRLIQGLSLHDNVLQKAKKLANL